MELKETIQKINKRLQNGEPDNISYNSYDDYTGYSPQHIIDAMNSEMLGQWGFEEVQTHTVNGEKGQLAVTQVKVWLTGVDFQPVAWGQARVTKGNVGDAKKGAQTDAIKKALSYFSIGNRAYKGLLPKPNQK